MPDAVQPDPKKSWTTLKMWLPILIGALLLTAEIHWFSWRPSFLEPSQNAVYRIAGGVWQRLPDLPGDPEKLQVSPGGAVWALYWHRGIGTELARWDGSAGDSTPWRIYRAADFGVAATSASNFALDGENVWAATDKGVLHWDGARWKLYREAISTREPSIVAAHGQAWVLGERGSLAHFDGAHWTQQQVELSGGVKWDDEWASSPQLARTEDGSLWIVRDGVWISDGPRWAAMKSGGADFHAADLVGATGQSIWLSDHDELVALAAGGPLKRFASAEMGISREGIEDMTESGGRIEVATSRGILEFDGSAWRRLSLPGNGVQGVVGIRPGAGGEMFAIVNIPHPLARARWQRLIRSIPLVLMLGVVAMIVWVVKIYKSQQLDEHQRLQQAVVHATGAVPEEFARDERLLAKQSSWWSASLTVGVILGASMGFFVARIFWPGLPSWIFLALALGLHVAVTVAQSLIRRTPRPWDPIEPGGPSFDWGPTRQALPAALGVFLLMNLGSFPVVWLLLGVAALMWYKVLEQKFIVWALRRANYDEALKVVRGFRFYNLEGEAAQFRLGRILLLAGRFREAEEALRRAVARLRLARSTGARA